MPQGRLMEEVQQQRQLLNAQVKYSPSFYLFKSSREKLSSMPLLNFLTILYERKKSYFELCEDFLLTSLKMFWPLSVGGRSRNDMPVMFFCFASINFSGRDLTTNQFNMPGSTECLNLNYFANTCTSSIGFATLKTRRSSVYMTICGARNIKMQ